MAYSRSESTLTKRLSDLEPLKQGRTHKWVVKDGEAWYWAGKIREALYIAREVFPHKYPELARAGKNFTIDVLDLRTVQARPKENTSPVEVPEVSLGRDGPGVTPMHGLEQAGPPGVPRTIAEPQSVTDIISYAMRALPTNDKLVFTNAIVNDQELQQLARWAASRTPRWMVVYSRSTGILTLGPWQPGVPHIGAVP